MLQKSLSYHSGHFRTYAKLWPRALTMTVRLLTQTARRSSAGLHGLDWSSSSYESRLASGSSFCFRILILLQDPHSDACLPSWGIGLGHECGKAHRRKQSPALVPYISSVNTSQALYWLQSSSRARKHNQFLGFRT